MSGDFRRGFVAAIASSLGRFTRPTQSEFLSTEQRVTAMAVGDFYLLTTHVRTAEGEMQFSFAYRQSTGTIGNNTLENVASFYRTNRLDKYILAVSEDIEVDKVVCRQVTSFTNPPGFVNLNNVEGTLIGEALPNNSAAVLKILTVAPNAKHNGRLFIPGIRELDHTSGVLAAGEITLLNDFGTILLAKLQSIPAETAEFIPIVISRFLDGVKRTPPVSFDLISIIADPNLKQQRKRGGDRFGLSD